jgi:surface polysaccharide O-acyltransferase-like enzyme
MPSIKTQPRFFYADMLRAISIIAVIILHSASDYDDQLGDIPMSHWWSGVVWDGLVRFCVPMFVVLSGAFLLKAGKGVTFKEVFFKRLPKILIPLVFWSVVYVLFKNYSDNKSITEINVKVQLKTFFEGPVYYHLWFLYMFAGIYLLYPIINFFITAAKEIHIRYFLIIWFITNSVFGILVILFDLNIGIDLNFFTGYSGYFVLGYYLVNYTFTPKQLRVIYWLGITGFLISSLVAYICIKLNFEDRAGLIESDFTPDIVLSVIGLFLWIKNRVYKNDDTGILHTAIHEISKESMGIYLVHVLVMETIFSSDRSYFKAFNDWHPSWGILVQSLIVLFISFWIIKLIKLIPYLKRVAG